jgi:hypothetical protein
MNLAKRWVNRLLAALVRWWNSLAELHEAPAKGHVHSWRRISIYASQCKSRDCGEVRFEEDVPPGFQEYVELMTSPHARLNAFEQAKLYRHFNGVTGVEDDGTVCPECGRMVPQVDAIGHRKIDCEYCGGILVQNFNPN